MSIEFSNNASGTNSVQVEIVDGTITLQTNEGLLFPSVTTASGNFFYATLEDTSGNIEIVKCTNNVGDVFTVTRAQENTSAQLFIVGSKVEQRTTAATFDEFIQRTGGTMTGTLDLNGEDLQDPVITSTGTGEIKGLPIRGTDGGTGNQLLVPTGGAAPTIGGNAIIHQGNDGAYVQTTFTLTGGEGLAAIGDLSTPRTIDLDITELNSIAGTSVAGDDEFLMYDTDAAEHKRMVYQQAGVPIITDSTSSITPTDADMNSMYLCTHAAAGIAFNLNSGIGEQGNFLLISQRDATQQVTVGGSGTTIVAAFAGKATREQYSVLVAVCTSDNNWTVYGDGV